MHKNVRTIKKDCIQKEAPCLGATQVNAKRKKNGWTELLSPNRNKIDQFLKRMVAEDEKWVSYDNVKRKRSWLNRNESAQTMVRPESTVK